jgi:hypothetical protein
VREYSDEELLNIIKEQGGDPQNCNGKRTRWSGHRHPRPGKVTFPGDRDLRKSWVRQARRASRYRASRLGPSFLASLADLGAGRCATLSGIALKTSQAGNEPTASQKRTEPRSGPRRPRFYVLADLWLLLRGYHPLPSVSRGRYCSCPLTIRGQGS